jgi:hypothetical protein
MARVINLAKNTEKEVKNLGWLLKNSDRVLSFTIDHTANMLYECVLVVRLTGFDNEVYECDFNSYEICREWLSKRRCFYGLRVTDKLNKHLDWRIGKNCLDMN